MAVGLYLAQDMGFGVGHWVRKVFGVMWGEEVCYFLAFWSEHGFAFFFSFFLFKIFFLLFVLFFFK